MTHRILIKTFFCIALILSYGGAAHGTMHFSTPVATNYSCDFMGAFKIHGVDAQPGDEVAFFDAQGGLHGSYVVETPGIYGITPVYGDDSASPYALTVKIWDASEGIELTGGSLVLSQGTPISGSSFIPSPIPPVWENNSGFVLNIDTAAHFASPITTPYVSDYAGNLVILGAPAEVGDEVAVFDPDGVLCGHARVTVPGQYGIVHIYGDDPDTQAIDEGAVENDVLTFKIWDKSAGLEYEGGNLLLTPGVISGSTFISSAIPPLWNRDTGFVLNIEAVPSCIPTPSDLVSWWKAEGNANDEKSGNNGTLMNGAAFASGRIGQAFSLDGVDDYVSIDIPTIDTSPGHNVTVQFWMYWNGACATMPFGFDLYDLEFACNDSFGFNTGNNDLWGTSSTGLANRWAHVAAVFNNGNIQLNKLYIDGMEKPLSNLIDPVNNSRSVTVNACLSGWPSSAGYYFNGLIDEVQIYNRALSASEIQAIYNAGNSGLCEITPPSVVEVSPTDGLTDVAADTVITAVFSEDMDPSTITNSTFLVSHGVTGTVSYDSASLTATFIPSSDLAYGTTYTVTINTGVKDLDGNRLPSDYTWTFATQPVCADLPSGIVSWWPGDGNANDHAGWNHGTAANGATYAAGRVGQAFVLDGVDDYVSIPNIVDNWSQGTIEAWVKYNDTTPGSAGTYIFSAAGYPPLGVAGNWDVTDLGIHPGYGPDLRFGLAGSWQWAASGVIPVVGRWYHVAGTWGADGMAIYIDGELKGTNLYNGLSGASNYNIIGASSWPGSSFKGTIDELKIFDRPLTAGEIQAIYRAGGLGMCDTSAPSVINVNPADGITDFAVDAVITAVFNEDMDASTITDSTFTVSGGVMGAVTYDIGTRTAKFTPSPNLSYGTTYTATITTGVKDLAGTPMASSYSWTFTTGNLQYVLTVTRSGTGNGTITAVPTGLYCDGDCVGTFDSGTAITLTANADAGSIFTGWSGGGCSGTGDCNITLVSDLSVTAGFVLVDSDQDGMDDAWELIAFGDLSHGSTDDADGDGLTDLEEFEQGTDPNAPDAMPPLAIAPEGQAFFRTSIDDSFSREFVISGGLPFAGSVSYYQLEVVSEQDGPQTPVDVFQGSTGDFRYRFETSGRLDGVYFIRVTDRRGVQVISQSVLISTLSQTPVGSTSAPAGSSCALTVSNPGGSFNGSRIEVPPGANTGGLILAFSTVDSGAPFVSAGELHGPVIHLEATDSNGDPVGFGTPVTVTLFYGGMIGNMDPLDLAIIHFNENERRWERVTPVTIDTVAQTLTFQTESFSLYGMVTPTECRFSLTGGSSQADFSMISVPGQPLGKNLRNHLESFLGAYDETQWRLFAYDPATGSYVEPTGTDMTRFDNDFSLAPGLGYWLISRTGKDITIPSLAHSESINSDFTTPPLSPGWNLVSHPWATPVDLSSHDIKISVDRTTWYSIDSGQFTDGTFWRFLGREGSPDNWYAAVSLSSEQLQPFKSYWIKNLTGGALYIKMIKNTDSAAVRSMETPGQLRMLAVKWIEKTLFSGIRTCIAQSAGDQPPDPPAVESGIRTIGVASGGGGGCFIRTAQGPVGIGRKDMAAGGLVFFSLLLAGIWWAFRSSRS